MRSVASVLGIGELLWDLFPDGPRLGGAPFNAIADLRRLGHPAAFVTAVGDDELGRAALAAADDLGVERTFIALSLDLPTGTVDVRLDEHGGHRFEIRSPAAYESIGDGEALAARIEAWGPQGLVYGTLAQRSPAVRWLTGRVATGIRPAHRLYDVNLRDGCWSPALVRGLLPLATIVKLNEPEADVLADILACDATAEALGERLASGFGVSTLCITRGPDGAVLWSDGRLMTVGGLRVDVADTVGAGDAFAAGLLHGILEGMSTRDAAAFANRLGALVASRPGAIPGWTVDELGWS